MAASPANMVKGKTNGTPKKMRGTGEINENQPFGNNPFVYIPGDVDENPFRLLWLDVLFVFQKSFMLPKIIIPLWPNVSGPFDELAPTWSNFIDLMYHMNLLAIQLFVIFTLPVMLALFWFLPGVVFLVYGVVFTLATIITMRLLNGRKTTECLVGLPEGPPVNDEQELWFFINGVATGKNWLQKNLNLLARTFQREVVGIHNTTFGFVFDLIECLIQRDLDYKTHDIRQARSLIRKALAATATKKLVLILHSQGGIEGSSMLDWLLSDLSHEVVSKLEIFTFGNAARRFNNPLVSDSKGHDAVDESKGGRGERVIKHIEHYANLGDFVANFGVLAFTSPEHQPFADGDAFAGTVFKRDGSGHLLNMHYLDTMFTMANGKVIEEGNTFMNSDIPDKYEPPMPVNDVLGPALTWGRPNSGTNGMGMTINGHGTRKIKDASRLWKYINGKMPVD